MVIDAKPYLTVVGDSHRKALGQFFTPPTVARFMARWVLKSSVEGIHDPSFGMGSFLDAVPETVRETFTGSELDSKILDYWIENVPYDASSVAVRQED